ncbi:MAG TPA: DUF1559 domain-containing protein [Gemmata sp.]|nr:DUF1559 domain-containing protein [Gemmata sp.]
MTRLRVLTAAALAAGLSMASGSLAQPPKPAGAPVPAGIPVVPKSSAAFLSVKLSEVHDHPDLKPVMEQLKKTPDAFDGLTELFGLAPHEIERVTLFWPSLADGPSAPVVAVTTREAYNEVRVLKNLRAEPVFGGRGHGHAPGHAVPKLGGGAGGGPPPRPPVIKEPAPDPGLPGGCNDPDGGPTIPVAAAAPAEPLFYEIRGSGFDLLFLVDERTLVFLSGGFGGDSTLLSLFAQLMQKRQTGPLADAIAAAGDHTLAGGVMLTPLFREFERGMPRELAPYAALTAARTGTVVGDLGKSAKFTVKLAFDDAAAARRAGPVFEEGLKALADKAAEEAGRMKDSRRPGEAAVAPLLLAAAGGMKTAGVKVEGSAVVATAEIDAGPAAAKAVAELLQSVASRKKFATRSNNLKQIGLALHNFHDANGALPQNVYGPKGEPLLSWRVQILPYIEQDNLWRLFKTDEPWDSENNKKLVEQMPKVFEVAGREAPKGHTYYQAFLTPDPQKQKGNAAAVGRTWLVEGGKWRTTLAQIPDGTSNTIGVAEARASVVWTKPDDLPFGEKLPPLGEDRADTFLALMLDGSVRALPSNLPADVLRILIDGQDGRVVPDELFEERRKPGGLAPRREEPAAKPPEAALPGLRQIPRELAEARERLAVETALLRVREAEALKIAEAVKVGAAPKIELEKAVALVREARVRLAACEQRIAEVEARLRVGDGSSNGGGTPPAKR